MALRQLAIEKSFLFQSLKRPLLRPFSSFHELEYQACWSSSSMRVFSAREYDRISNDTLDQLSEALDELGDSISRRVSGFDSEYSVPSLSACIL